MTLNRRRLLISASAMGLAGAAARLGTRDGQFAWRGTAIGSDAEIRIAGLDRRAASRLVGLATGEIERLEKIFSLYRPGSELSRLNGDGVLAAPSQDFRILLEQSLGYHHASGGAFNVAIQPVWTFLARHFAANREPPSAAQLRTELRHCDVERINAAGSRISLAPGMALTFNGIAQGYITDQVAALFMAEGLRDILINLGEIRALPGRHWRVAIDGQNRAVDLGNRAIAQSAGRGTPFTADGRWHHLIDPETGASANRLRAVTVRAATATCADALSTALFTCRADAQAGIAARFPDAEIDDEAAAT